MTQGINYENIAPDAVAAIMHLERHVRSSGMDPVLLELVRLRASYQNGCGYCVDMHTKDARLLGESEQRLYAVPVWRETPFFSPRERAALAWTEALTLLAHGPGSEPPFEEARSVFSEAELATLTMTVIAINCWNRLVRTSNRVAGSYEPAAAPRPNQERSNT